MRDKRYANQEVVREVILKLCSEKYLSLQTLAELLGRKRDTIRNHYIKPMLSEGLLQLRYPELSHPQQAYKTVSA